MKLVSKGLLISFWQIYELILKNSASYISSCYNTVAFSFVPVESVFKCSELVARIFYQSPNKGYEIGKDLKTTLHFVFYLLLKY